VKYATLPQAKYALLFKLATDKGTLGKAPTLAAPVDWVLTKLYEFQTGEAGVEMSITPKKLAGMVPVTVIGPTADA
jgi:hypothetical protein